MAPGHGKMGREKGVDMIEAMLEALTALRVAELEEGNVHPCDLPREELVDRLTMTDSLARGGAATPEEHQRRAEDIHAIFEARARLAFAPGAKRVLGVQGVHRKKGEILVGDRVRLSGAFLRNTGQYFHGLEQDDHGTVESISSSPYDDWRIATVRWDRYGLPGGDQHLSECYCEGDERPTCETCGGTGRRMARVNVRNLERLKQQEPYAPF